MRVPEVPVGPMIGLDPDDLCPGYPGGHAWLEVTTHADHLRHYVCAWCPATKEEPRADLLAPDRISRIGDDPGQEGA